MSANPLISIIIPVYNSERFLHRCLNSVVNQTYKDFEVILVDDGSHDESGVICDEYAAKDNRFRIFHNPNGGPSKARNFGLEHSAGNYLLFIDSDDWLEEDALATYSKALSTDTPPPKS